MKNPGEHYNNPTNKNTTHEPFTQNENKLKINLTGAPNFARMSASETCGSKESRSIAPANTKCIKIGRCAGLFTIQNSFLELKSFNSKKLVLHWVFGRNSKYKKKCTYICENKVNVFAKSMIH